MEAIGVNSNLILVTFFNLLVIGVWLVLGILALFQLRRREMPETARAIWAVLIVVVPLAGAIAFWIVQPGRRLSETN